MGYIVSMEIALIHSHYDNDHLQEVKKEMQELGAPSIRAIWSDLYGMWLAVEGCHRIRAAADLGIVPDMVDVSDEHSIVIELDGEDIEVDVADLAVELSDAAPRAAMVRFDD